MAFKNQSAIDRPLARSERLLVESIEEETVIYDLDSNIAHALKPLAAAVFMYATGENTAAEIAELSSHRLATTVTEAEVSDAVSQLDALSLLDRPQLEISEGGLSRRTALKTFAAAGAGAVLVTSVAAPAALAADTPCSPNGDYNSSEPACAKDMSGNPPSTAFGCTLVGSSGCSSGFVACCIPCDWGTKIDNGYCCQMVCVSGGTCPGNSIKITTPGTCPSGGESYNSSPYTGAGKCCGYSF